MTFADGDRVRTAADVLDAAMPADLSMFVVDKFASLLRSLAYLAGQKVWWSWFVGLGAQFLWLGYALATQQYGFVVSAVAYGWVYGRNGLAWASERGDE